MQLIEEYGEEVIYRSGFKVYTTLDNTLQATAERIVNEQIQQLTANNALMPHWCTLMPLLANPCHGGVC